MNGVHDMGGMHGLGPVVPEPDEPVFHARWEARMLALNLAMGAWGAWNLDASRHSKELIPGPDYLRMSYYEKWYVSLVDLMVEAGLVTREEVASGRPRNGADKATPRLPGSRVAGALRRGGPATREGGPEPSFEAGARVRARNVNPTGHTRLPRYARGKVGVVQRDHGMHVFPDTNAHGLGESPQHLYSVRFSARELWGDHTGPNEAVYLDLWDDHLEPA